jgi:hypothetical protein
MTPDELKARIKQLAADGCALRNRIRQTHGPERHALWNATREFDPPQGHDPFDLLAGLRG